MKLVSRILLHLAWALSLLLGVWAVLFYLALNDRIEHEMDDALALRAETIQGVSRFVELYHGEYDPRRLISRLHRVDPLTIYREGRAMGVNLAGYKKCLYQVYAIYNGTSKNNVLPMKF